LLLDKVDDNPADQRLGDGVISSTFEAQDPKLDRSVSLKILNYVLSKNAELAEAFKREALAAAALNSPHVLKVYEFGVHNGQPYMVMENTEGRYLNALMQERRLSDHRILHITEGIVQGLMDTDEQGIVHGDVMRRVRLHGDDVRHGLRPAVIY
jgi:serine/threonine-protein kinase